MVAVLKHVTSRWEALVPIVFCNGTHRFDDLRRATGGVSERIFVQTLRQPGTEGLVRVALVDRIEKQMPDITRARSVRLARGVHRERTTD
jgi:DNA-binding HxlR family transcriptional regulator